MDLALRRPWVGLLLFFSVGMVLFETGETCRILLMADPEAVIRMAQNSMTDGNVLQDLVEKAMKNGDNTKMIKGIKGLKIKDLGLPKTAMNLVPEDKMDMAVVINITVAGKSFIGGNMEITVVAELNIYGKVSKSTEQQIGIKIMECKVNLMSCKTNLPSSMLPKIVNKFLDSTLGKVMPGVLCPASDTLVKKLLEAFTRMFEKKPIGKSGFILYELAEDPEVLSSYINIHLKIKLEKANGEIIELPCVPLPDDLPPKEEGETAVYVPVTIINAIMGMLQDNFKFVVTKVKGSVPTTDQLNKICPEAGLPAGKQTKVAITQNDNLEFTVTPTGSYMTSRSKAAFQSLKDGTELLSVDMVQECNANFNVKNEKLAITVEPGSCRTIEITSPTVDVEPAKEYMKSVMDECVPQLNSVLSENQVPLPSVLRVTGMKCEPKITFAENVLIFGVMIKSHDKKAMARKVKQKCNALKFS